MNENLTLENFWNALYEKFPKGCKVFCDWIDAYKEKYNWAKLFNIGSPHYQKMGWHTPKFHDLPFAMQLGIWMEFAYEHGKDEDESISEFFEFDLRFEISKAIETLNS